MRSAALVPWIHVPLVLGLFHKFRPINAAGNLLELQVYIPLLSILNFAKSGQKMLLYPHWNPTFLLDTLLPYSGPLNSIPTTCITAPCPILFYSIHTSHSKNPQKCGQKCGRSLHKPAASPQLLFQPFRTIISPMVYSTYYPRDTP